MQEKQTTSLLPEPENIQSVLNAHICKIQDSIWQADAALEAIAIIEKSGIDDHGPGSAIDMLLQAGRKASSKGGAEIDNLINTVGITLDFQAYRSREERS